MFLYIPNIIPVYLNKLKWKLIFVFLENQALFFYEFINCITQQRHVYFRKINSFVCITLGANVCYEYCETHCLCRAYFNKQHLTKFNLPYPVFLIYGIRNEEIFLLRIRVILLPENNSYRLQNSQNSLKILAWPRDQDYPDKYLGTYWRTHSRFCRGWIS